MRWTSRGRLSNPSLEWAADAAAQLKERSALPSNIGKSFRLVPAELSSRQNAQGTRGSLSIPPAKDLRPY